MNIHHPIKRLVTVSLLIMILKVCYLFPIASSNSTPLTVSHDVGVFEILVSPHLKSVAVDELKLSQERILVWKIVVIVFSPCDSPLVWMFVPKHTIKFSSKNTDFLKLKLTPDICEPLFTS